MISSDGSPYYPTSNIWWHMKHRLFLLGQLIFLSQSMMHCLAVLAFKVRKGTGFLHASDLPVSDDEDEATSWCSVIEAWGMIWHDSSPWDWLFWCLLVAFPCLFGRIKLLFGMCLFITHYYLCIIFFDTLVLLNYYCVCGVFVEGMTLCWVLAMLWMFIKLSCCLY